jgi:hypothetical protein
VPEIQAPVPEGSFAVFLLPLSFALIPAISEAVLPLSDFQQGFGSVLLIPLPALLKALINIYLFGIHSPKLFQLSFNILFLFIVFGFQRGNFVIKLKLSEVEKLFHHLGAVFISQLKEFLKLSLRNDDGAFEVIVT